MSGYLAMLVAKARGSASRIRSRPDAMFELARVGEPSADGPDSFAEPLAGHEETDDRALLSHAADIDGDQPGDGGEAASVSSGGHRTLVETGQPQRLIPVLDEHAGAKSVRAPELRPSRVEPRPVERRPAGEEADPGHDARRDVRYRKVDFERVDFNLVEADGSASSVEPVAADGRHPKAAAGILPGTPGLTAAPGRQHDRVGAARPRRRGPDRHDAPANLRPHAYPSEGREQTIGRIEEKGADFFAEVRAPRFTEHRSARSGIPVDATSTDGGREVAEFATAGTPRKGARSAIARDTRGEPPRDDGSAVHITIGRIEIKGPGQPPPPAQPRRVMPDRLDLKDYLIRRMRGDNHG